MNRLLLLLLSLSLLATACKKDPSAPDPSLEGRWNSRSTTGYSYDAAGQLLSQDSVADVSYYMVITPDSLNYYDITNGSSWGRHKYTRQGNALQYSRAKCTITRLSEHTLSLRFQNIDRVPNMPYSEWEDNYSR